MPTVPSLPAASTLLSPIAFRAWKQGWNSEPPKLTITADLVLLKVPNLKNIKKTSKAHGTYEVWHKAEEQPWWNATAQDQ